MSQAKSNDLSVWNLETATDWKLAFLKIALPFIDLPSLENLSDEQKQNIVRQLVLMVYRDFDDLAIERLKNQSPFQWQAFQPEFLEFVIQALPERIKGYPIEAPTYLKEILTRSVLAFLNLSDIALSPSESELEVVCQIVAVALFKDSMVQGFWWLNFEAESFFEALSQLTRSLPQTETNALKIDRVTTDNNSPTDEEENALSQSRQNEKPCPKKSLDTFYMGLDDFDEPQVYFGNLPFQERGYYKHELLKGLIEGGGIADIGTLSKSLNLDCDQFKGHVNAIKSDFKKIMPGHILLRTKKGKIRLDWEIGQSHYPKTTQA